MSGPLLEAQFRLAAAREDLMAVLMPDCKHEDRQELNIGFMCTAYECSNGFTGNSLDVDMLTDDQIEGAIGYLLALIGTKLLHRAELERARGESDATHN